jgi:hypothetical protein
MEGEVEIQQHAPQYRASASLPSRWSRDPNLRRRRRTGHAGAAALRASGLPERSAGRGYPVFTDVQGQAHLGSLGCLVTDGESTYALTNKHVAGPVGREAYTIVASSRQRIGTSAGKEIGNRPFADVYLGWPGAHSVLNLDVGLVHVDDVTRWTAQVYGIGELGPIWDLHTNSFNLDMIGCPVVASGAASGRIEA